MPESRLHKAKAEAGGFGFLPMSGQDSLDQCPMSITTDRICVSDSNADQYRSVPINLCWSVFQINTRMFISIDPINLMGFAHWSRESCHVMLQAINVRGDKCLSFPYWLCLFDIARPFWSVLFVNNQQQSTSVLLLKGSGPVCFKLSRAILHMQTILGTPMKWWLQ